jgi:hypothetical protein
MLGLFMDIWQNLPLQISFYEVEMVYSDSLGAFFHIIGADKSKPSRLKEKSQTSPSR